MEVVTGATVSLLSKLGGILQEEYKLQDKVKKDIESLQKELIFMNATLLMVAEVPPDRIHPLVRTWATLIRELSYDMEDVVSTFVAELHSNGSTDLGGLTGLCMKASSMLCMGTSHHRIAGMIEEMTSLTKELTELRDRYLLDSIYIGPTTESLLPAMNPGNGNSRSSEAGASRAATYDTVVEFLVASRQLIHKQEPVGAVTSMRILREWITRSSDFEKHRSVLSIVGIGGAGKTTIATALFHEFSNQFDCRASVTVSPNYDQDQVLRDILGQIKTADSSNCSENNVEIMDHDQLLTELKMQLHGKRYLLLIDDLWSAVTWHNIRIWLPYDNTRDSRVIVTTRFQAVAAACSERDGTDLLYPVDLLTDVDSHSLFNQCSERASTRYDVVDGTGSLLPEADDSGGSENNEAPEEIWKYCGGLPLAIVSIAGLVACNPEKKADYWSKSFKSLFQQKVPLLTLHTVTRTLDYCYNDLPSDLKTCTLYLSIFQKGMTISRKRLTRRWISECFVTEKQELSAEEVAESFFNQLISRKIICPVNHSSNGKVKSFKVHGMILEYILSKASEENFITVVGGHWLMPTPSNKVRRLSMQICGSNHENSTQGMNLSQVRSLTVFGSQNRRLPFHLFNNALIQVLDLEGWRCLTDKHLANICKMVRLKYLSLRRTNVSVIPSKIEKLQYLETLDIRETNVVVLPKSFVNLKLLRTMLGGSKKQRKALRLPQGKHGEPMKSLRILSGVQITDDDSAAVAGLYQFTGLRKLAIYMLNIQEGGRTSEELRSSIEHLCSCDLQTLAINDEGSHFINSLANMFAPPRYIVALELSGKMERTPKWIRDLSNLYKLTLSVTVLRTDTFELIKGLPQLFSLTFTLSAKRDDKDIMDILEENKQLTDTELIVPPGGFESLRACLFGLWLAGCAAVQGKLLCRESCFSEFDCLATWLAGWLLTNELSKIPREY